MQRGGVVGGQGPARSQLDPHPLMDQTRASGPSRNFACRSKSTGLARGRTLEAVKQVGPS